MSLCGGQSECERVARSDFNSVRLWREVYFFESVVEFVFGDLIFPSGHPNFRLFLWRAGMIFAFGAANIQDALFAVKRTARPTCCVLRASFTARASMRRSGSTRRSTTCGGVGAFLPSRGRHPSDDFVSFLLLRLSCRGVASEVRWPRCLFWPSICLSVCRFVHAPSNSRAHSDSTTKAIRVSWPATCLSLRLVFFTTGGRYSHVKQHPKDQLLERRPSVTRMQSIDRAADRQAKASVQLSP